MATTPTHITLAEAAEQLGVHYMTAYRYVRTGRLPAEKVGQEWQVDQADVQSFLHDKPDASSPPRSRGTRTHEYPRRLVERLIIGDEAGAWTVVESAMSGGMTPDAVYLELLGPALESVGQRWADGELSIAQEHQASAVALRLIGRLGPRFARRGRKRGTLLLGAPPGDVHGIPTALMGDLLRGRSLQVIDLGADVPAESWRSTAAGTQHLLAIGICASTPDNEDRIRAAIGRIREVTPVPIVLGGNGIVSAASALDLGATSYSTSFADAVAQLDTYATGRAAS